MQRHPEIGARDPRAADFEDIRGWVLAHHERPDGKGYPSGWTATRSRSRRASWPWPTPTRR